MKGKGEQRRRIMKEEKAWIQTECNDRTKNKGRTRRRKRRKKHGLERSEKVPAYVLPAAIFWFFRLAAPLQSWVQNLFRLRKIERSSCFRPKSCFPCMSPFLSVQRFFSAVNSFCLTQHRFFYSNSKCKDSFNEALLHVCRWVLFFFYRLLSSSLNVLRSLLLSDYHLLALSFFSHFAVILVRYLPCSF